MYNIYMNRELEDLLDKNASIERMFALCRFYGIKNKELAIFLNVQEETVSRWRQNKIFPTLEKFMLFAYALGIELDDVLIHKKLQKDDAIIKIKRKVFEAKEKSRISYLKNRLENDKTDFHSYLETVFSNPLLERYVSIDSISSPDVQDRRDVAIYDLRRSDGYDFLNRKIAPIEQRNSLFLEWNNSSEHFLDTTGKPFNGTYILKNRFILHFKDGLFDGDIYESGKIIAVRPAIETLGHVEFWRNGRIHREDFLPAVISNGFSLYEYWENGVRVK